MCQKLVFCLWRFFPQMCTPLSKILVTPAPQSPPCLCPVRSFHYRLWEIGSVTSLWRFTSWEYIVTAKGGRGLILEQFMSKDWNLEWFHINTSMYARVSCKRKISRQMQNFANFSRNFAFFRKKEAQTMWNFAKKAKIREKN